jgi:hypothetical protein
MKLTDYGILAAILTAILTGGKFLYSSFKAQQLKYRTKLQNNWTNEGNVGEPLESHYIILSLNVDPEDGEITGIITSRNLTTESDFRLSVNGKIWFKTAQIEFTKVSQGRISILGKAKLRFRNTKILTWSIVEDYNDFFPDRTTVWTCGYNLMDN